MKLIRAIAMSAAAILLLALAAGAQVPGAMRQGVCCGISTSNGPTAFNFPQSGLDIPGATGFGHHAHDGFRNDRQVIFVPVYPSYGYYSGYGYPAYPYATVTTATPAENNPTASDTTEPPGFTVYERRKDYRLKSAEPEATVQPQPAATATSPEPIDPHAKVIDVAPRPAAAPEENVITVLVYKDGHQRELHDYAVIGGAIYDLSRKPGSGPNKILLAELDLTATLKLNQDHGVEFNLPKSVR